MGFWWFMFICNMLIPTTMVIGGYIMWKHCPSKINRISGYRTTRSMKNMDTWKFAHDYFGRLWWKTGWILVILTIVVQLLFTRSRIKEVGILSIVVVFIQGVVMLLSIVSTENALKKKFDDNGSVR